MNRQLRTSGSAKFHDRSDLRDAENRSSCVVLKISLHLEVSKDTTNCGSRKSNNSVESILISQIYYSLSYSYRASEKVDQCRIA